LESVGKYVNTTRIKLVLRVTREGLILDMISPEGNGGFN